MVIMINNKNMKKLYLKSILLLLAIVLGESVVVSQTQATVTVQESAGNCGLMTDCDSNIICVDIVLTLSESKTLDSYNIWVEYNGDVISREAFGVNNNTPVGDNSCVIANGAQDTDLEGPGFNPDHWRVAGVPGNGFPMTANVPAVIHTICFIILQPTSLSGQPICVGGIVNPLLTTVTFTDGTSDVDVPETCMTVDETFTSCSILPVGLMSFDISKSGNTSILNWTTSYEFNSDYFEVQHADKKNVFSAVGRVSSLGDAASLTAYKFVDEFPQEGINYYRLKQVDRDGNFQYSAVRSVVFTGRNFHVGVWPNPSTGLLNLEIQGAGEFVDVKLINSTGQIVFSNVFEAFQHNSRLNIESISPGHYTLVVQSAQEYFSQKIVVIK